MFQCLSPVRHAKSRHSPRFDSLEGRIALTGDGNSGATQPLTPPDGATMDVGSVTQEAPLSLRLINPAPDSVLTISPLSLDLVFNRPIFPDTVDSDVVVLQTDSAGNPTGYTAPNELTVNSEATRLTVALLENLKPGHYQIWVVGTSSIMDIDGNYLTDGVNNLMVDQFDVAVPRVTLGDAVDLGTAGPSVQDVTGSLDFESNPYAVSLYQIRLDPGHFWRLGLEVSAQRDGGTLDTALALFDDQGRALATDEVGRQDAPYDPYLFAGLKPGTYYVGVSGTNNLPGPKGGYDPATGSAGSVPQTQDGGPFTLHVVADPEDTPPQLVSFAVDHGDALTPDPTGVTLGFSRAISLTSEFGDLAPILSKSIEVVDQDGSGWPVEVSEYHESDAKISFLFDQFLPPGHYIVLLPKQGGLVDLAGLSPIADGQPPHVLGQFDMAVGGGSRDPLNLGVLLPRAASDGVNIDVTLSEGQAARYRVVVSVPGLYKFEAQSSADPPSIQMIGPGLDRTLSLDGTNDTLLSPGVYFIVFKVPTTGSLSVHSFLHIAADEIEIVLANGVGQGPALSLRLISVAALSPAPPPPSPTPVDPQVSPAPQPAPLPPVSATFFPAPLSRTDGGVLREESTGSTRLASGPSIGGMPSTAPAGAVSFLGPASDLVGRPVIEEVESGSLAMGFSPRGDSQAFGGVAHGQSLTLLLSQPTRSTSLSSDPIVGEMPTSHRTEAGMIGLDTGRAIEALVGLQQWAIGWGESVVEWAEAWTNGRPSFGYPVARIAQLNHGLGTDQPNISSGALAATRHGESADSSIGRPWFFSPPVVALSVAGIAQGCWHYAHSRKSRSGAGMGEPSKHPAPVLLSNNGPRLTPLHLRYRVTPMSQRLSRKSHAS